MIERITRVGIIMIDVIGIGIGMGVDMGRRFGTMGLG